MKIVDNFIDRKIGKVMLEKAEQKEADYIPSGRLSASRLAEPLQWQVLGVLQAQSRKLDEYVVRKFERGNHIEEWVMQYFDLIPTEKDGEHDKVYYREVSGRIDALVDTSNWDFPCGIIPVEIKSVANAKFKRILRNGADRSHILQACLYALSKKTDWFAVCYVAADDYRVQTYMFETADYKEEVDTVIDLFDEAIKKKEIPEFVPIENWQANIKYQKFPEWANKSKEELKELSKELFKNYNKKHK